MEPRQAGQGLRQESQPKGPHETYQVGGEFYSDQQVESMHERHEDAPSRVEQGAAQPAVPTLPVPVIAQSATDAAIPTASDDSALLAADDDLIEKEWVDKAKKIIQDTRDDPYVREREVSKLQIEYIRKRYGRIIGSSGD